VRQVGGLASGIDNEHQMITAIGDDQVVENFASSVRKQRVALPLL
jgi:hypothetical protein